MSVLIATAAQHEPFDHNSLRWLFELYIAHKLATASEKTHYRYRYSIDLFAQCLGREPMLTDLRDEVIGVVIGWIQKRRRPRLSAATASKFRDCILAAWRFGARKGIVAHWPDVPDVKEPVRIPVAWTKDELAKLWSYISRMPGELCGISASDWFCSLHAVLWDSGARIGETMQLRWENVDLSGGWVTMKAETRKGGLSDKLSKLHPSTVELLDRIRFPERKIVWPWPYHETYLWKHYGEILRRAGLPDGRERKFHCMRKSCASHITAIVNEAAAQSAMGHADIRMTRGVYIDPKIARPPAPSDFLFRPGETDPPRAA